MSFRSTSLPSFLQPYHRTAALLDMAGLVPGLLTTREENITEEAGRWLDCSQWPDLVLAGLDGALVECHRAVLLPLSRVLQEILASTPDVFSQDVTTVCLPVPGVELAKLVKLIYKGTLAPWTEHQSCQVGERFRDLRFWENTTEAFLGLPYKTKVVPNIIL